MRAQDQICKTADNLMNAMAERIVTMSESPCKEAPTEARTLASTAPGRGRLVIVTGISGAAVGYSIHTARSAIGSEATAHVRLDENYLVKGAEKFYGERLRRDRPTITFANLIHEYPDSVLFNAWPIALHLAKEEIEREIAAGKTVFLQMHMSLLHNESRSILSAIDARVLKEVIDPYRAGASIVCVIDDASRHLRSS